MVNVEPTDHRTGSKTVELRTGPTVERRGSDACKLTYLCHRASRREGDGLYALAALVASDLLQDSVTTNKTIYDQHRTLRRHN